MYSLFPSGCRLAQPELISNFAWFSTLEQLFFKLAIDQLQKNLTPKEKTDFWEQETARMNGLFT